MQEENTYFKYFSDSDIIIKSIFENKKIRFTQPWAFNDPLEFNQKFKFTTNYSEPYLLFNYKGLPLPSLEEFTRMLLIRNKTNRSGILSLTLNRNSFNMWNIYANGHKGFLMEFHPGFNKHPDFKTKDKKEYYLIKPVKYVSENYININEIVKYTKTKFFNYIFNHLWYVKSKRWEHELEYRIVRPLFEASNYININDSMEIDEKVYLFDFPLEVIKSLYFGAHMSIKNKKYIIDKCQPYNINFFQAVIIKDLVGNDGYEGDVKFLSVGDSKDISLEKYFDMYPQYFSFPKEQYPNTLEKDINTLEELPYYKGNEIVVDRLVELLIKKFGK